MALLRKLSQQITNFKQFNRDGLTGKECQSKKLLVVGVGHIGSEVVKIGESLGMEVFGVDLKKKYDFVNYFSLEEVLGKADVIVCAMNLTAENTGYFSYSRLKQARKGVIFINIARGEMSPSLDLLRLVEEGHLGGLALDVYNQESELAVALRKQSPISSQEIRANMVLRSKENVILTPHNAFNTEESVRRKARQSVQQILHFFEHKAFQWEVGE
jgi:D-lactate dehydrogenase